MGSRAATARDSLPFAVALPRIGAADAAREPPGSDLANASKPRSLGEFFSAYVFPEEETARLAALAAQEGSTASHIIARYVTRTAFYQSHFVKREKIAGCRPGSPLYKERAIERIVGYLGKSSGESFRVMAMRLYREAASLFIREELSSLNKLLTDIPLPEGAPSGIDALKEVCSRALDFAVTGEQITKFYEVWGVPRVDDFADALPVWMQADEAHLQKRQLLSLAAELSTLRTEMRDTSAALAKQVESLERERQQATVDRERLRAHDGILESLSQRLADLVHGMESAEPRIKALEDRISRIGEKVTQSHREQLSRQDLKNDLHKIETSTKAAIGHAGEATTTALRKLLQEDIQSLRGEFDSKLAAHAADLSKRREPHGVAGGGTAIAAGYRSPLVGVLNHIPNPNKLTSEPDFVNSWKHLLAQSFDVVLSIEEAFAYHRAFLANHVVVCDRALAQSWIDCLGWHSSTIHMAASPTWSGEEDWAQGAEHVFKRDATRLARIVVIHNYDVGLTDCYLAPSLALWALQGDARLLSKIFLLPSTQGQPLTSLLLEHSISCTDEVPLTPSLSLKDGVRAPPELRRDIPMGVEPKVAAGWAQHVEPVDYDLTALQSALKCRISPHIVRNFRRTTSFVAQFLDDTSSVGLALHHQVAPWIHATYGDDKFNEFETFLKQLRDSGY